MSNITFLLGAGASANALPVTNEIPMHLGFMASHIEKYIKTTDSDKYLSDIRELLTHLGEFNTLDSYARGLSQNRVNADNLQLNKLKSILCGLFMFEQLKKKNEIVNPYSNVPQSEIDKMKRTIDLRYKSFFAKILDGEKINDTINILSWNYDMQLEIGLESNLGYNYDELYNSCLIYPHPSCKLETKNASILNWNKTPKIVKLNGTAGVFLNKDSFHSIYLSQKEYFEERFEVLLDIHREVRRYYNYNPFLKFAWEKDEHSKKAIEYASQIVSRTNILVVIGYSFPDFNRPIDKQIFGSSNISEVFLQLPNNDFDNVKYNMRASLGSLAGNCKSYFNLREFFIPSQFIPVY